MSAAIVATTGRLVRRTAVENCIVERTKKRTRDMVATLPDRRPDRVGCTRMEIKWWNESKMETLWEKATRTKVSRSS